MKQFIFLLQKEFVLELRKSYQLLSLLMYVISTVFCIYLINQELEPYVWLSFFWIVQLFVVVNNAQKTFSADRKNRYIYYQSICTPQQFILAKLIYQLVLNALMLLISVLVFYVLLGWPIVNTLSFFFVAFAGNCAISIVFTLLSAIGSKSKNANGLIAILGMPIVLPFLLVIMRLCRYALGEVFKEGAVTEMILIVLATNILLFVLSIILYPNLWKD